MTSSATPPLQVFAVVSAALFGGLLCELGYGASCL